MTVCIAAISGDGADSQIVVAADRMVTYPGFLEFEHRGSKIVELNEKALVMVAGDSLIGGRLAREAAGAVPGDPPAAADIAADLGMRYDATRRQQMEDQVLRSRGLTLADFYGRHGTLGQQGAMVIDQQLAMFNLNVELLLAAVDQNGAHLHTVHNPGGGDRNHDAIAYAAIGSGAIHVLPAMTGFRHGPGAPHAETLVRVYAAKRQAEVAPGVGKDTEVAVVSSDGIERLSTEDIGKLEAIYEQVQEHSRAALRNAVSEFKLGGDGDDDDDRGPEGGEGHGAEHTDVE
jgi:hypothetical protein